MTILYVPRRISLGGVTAPTVIATHFEESEDDSGTYGLDLTGTGINFDMQEDDMLFGCSISDQGLLGGGDENFGGFADTQPDSHVPVDLVEAVTTGVPGYRIAYIRMGSTPLATVNMQENYNRHVGTVLANIRGVDWASLLDGDIEVAIDGTSDTMPAIPSQETFNSNSLRIVVGGLDDCNSINTPLVPSGFENFTHDTASQGSASVSSYTLFATRVEVSPGVNAPGTWPATSVTSSARAAWHLAFNGI